MEFSCIFFSANKWVINSSTPKLANINLSKLAQSDCHDRKTDLEKSRFLCDSELFSCVSDNISINKLL